MKKAFWLFVMVGVLFGMCTSALGQDPEEHGKLVEQIVSQIKSVLNADSVLGTPRDFAGTKVVPIVSILFGFGSGSGAASLMAEDQGKGSGAGGGGGIKPDGLLVITPDGEVQVIAAKKGALTELLQAVVPAIMEALRTEKRQED